MAVVQTKEYNASQDGTVKVMSSGHVLGGENPQNISQMRQQQHSQTFQKLKVNSTRGSLQVAVSYLQRQEPWPCCSMAGSLGQIIYFFRTEVS